MPRAIGFRDRRGKGGTESGRGRGDGLGLLFDGDGFSWGKWQQSLEMDGGDGRTTTHVYSRHRTVLRNG